MRPHWGQWTMPLAARSWTTVEGLEEGTGLTESRPRGQRYRCGHVCERLTRWLRRQDVEGGKPLHTLREEAGSIIATKAGCGRGHPSRKQQRLRSSCGHSNPER